MNYRTQLTSVANERYEMDVFLTATRMLTSRIRVEPNNPEHYFERSICYHKIGDFQASLDDANTAIRLNSDDYNVHYQKGLALLGLNSLNEAVISFKKSIELRARQDETKLSEIWKLLREALAEYQNAKQRLGITGNHQAACGRTVLATRTNQPGAILARGQDASNDPVDSNTDRPLLHQPGTSSNHSHHLNHHHNQNMTSIEGLNQANGNNSLVAATTNRNNQPISISSQVLDSTIGTNHRVSPSASQITNHNNNNNNNNHHHHHHTSSINISPDISSINVDAQTTGADLLGEASNQSSDQAKAQFEWNIRRSERIFLHQNEPGTSGGQYGILTSGSVPIGPQSSRQKTSSNPSSINSGSRGTKRSQPSGGELQASAYQQPNKLTRSKDGASSVAESDVDVDDSYNPNSNNQAFNNDNSSNNINDSSDSRKRVMVAPSSSMPATSHGPSTSASGSKDDSYSSKYKRLRRDRERARRGTSKLCTIKPSDLEELQRSPNTDSARRFMRVIAPIDGWLYSGQLSIEDNRNSGAVQYVVKLDGDVTGSSYLFSQDTVLNDVIKEVRVKSVSELRKGARICCYWSRQYKCLSTGVVTSRTFEATKSLVSVKYDNGDLSALPLEDLRLLPPDYPKYMSNCDPLLLARNGDGYVTATSVSSSNANLQNGNRIIVDSCKPALNSPESRGGLNSGSFDTMETPTSTTSHNLSSGVEAKLTNKSFEDAKVFHLNESMAAQESYHNEQRDLDENNEEEEGEEEELVDDDDDEDDVDNDRDEDATIPPTDETIDFITSESTLKHQDENQRDSINLIERVSITKDNITTTNETQTSNNNNSRASSEENNYGVEYRPWMFDGPPRRSKRHGRTYRDNYLSIRRGDEIIRVGDSAELMPRDESILPFIAKIDGLWATGRGEMRVRVRWYYRLVETEGEPFELRDSENALFETDHFDENDVQSIFRSTKILTWTEYSKNNLGHVNKINDNTPKIFYLAGYYDPVRQVKHLRSDVKEAQ